MREWASIPFEMKTEKGDETQALSNSSTHTENMKHWSSCGASLEGAAVARPEIIKLTSKPKKGKQVSTNLGVAVEFWVPPELVACRNERMGKHVV